MLRHTGLDIVVIQAEPFVAFASCKVHGVDCV